MALGAALSVGVALALAAALGPAGDGAAGPVASARAGAIDAGAVAGPAGSARGPLDATGRPAGPDTVRLGRAWPGMGTLFRAAAYAPDSAAALAALRAARATVASLDSLLSSYRPDSEVSELGRAAGSGAWIDLSPETVRLLVSSVEWARRTDGAFDPTVGPLVEAWGFRGGSARIPNRALLDSVRALVDWRAVHVDPVGRSARLGRAGMEIDLGGIGKGYALDRAAAAMRAAGASGGMLDLGGNVRVFGRGPGPGGAWPIGIRDPRCPERVLGEVYLDSGSVATSGDYERFFERGGERFSHILGPRTGRPARGVLQVTVAAPDGLTADVLSTALFVMGPEAGRRLLVREPGAEGAAALWVPGVREDGGAGAAGRRRRPAGPPSDVLLAGERVERFDLGTRATSAGC